MKGKLDIVEIRSKLGITQQVLADMLGVSRKYISMVETGSKPLSKKLAQKLAHMADAGIHRREQTWTTGPDGTVRERKAREHSYNLTGAACARQQDTCPNCERLEKEIDFLRARLTEALSKIPTPPGN